MKCSPSDRLVGHRRRFGRDESRRLLAMLSDGHTLESVAATLGRSPEAVEIKAMALGVVKKCPSWSDQQQATRVRLLAKKPNRTLQHAGEPWSLEDDRQLRDGILERLSARMIAEQTQRTTRAVRRRAELLNLSWITYDRAL
jgi:hypothetical protein